MNWDQIEGNWQEFAGSARAHWDKLTDGDWQKITGKKEHLVECIEKRYGVAKEEAKQQIDRWSSALLEVVGRSGTR